MSSLFPPSPELCNLSPLTLEGKGICSGVNRTRCPEFSNLNCVLWVLQRVQDLRRTLCSGGDVQSRSVPLDGGVAEEMAELQSHWGSSPYHPLASPGFLKRVGLGPGSGGLLLGRGGGWGRELTLQLLLDSSSHCGPSPWGTSPGPLGRECDPVKLRPRAFAEFLESEGGDTV